MKPILLKLNEEAAKVLSVLCKRAIIERVEPFADSCGEAGEMLAALDELQAALEKQGFSPR